MPHLMGGATRKIYGGGTNGISSANLAGEISRGFGLIENEWIPCKNYRRGRAKFIFGAKNWRLSEKSLILSEILNL